MGAISSYLTPEGVDEIMLEQLDDAISAQVVTDDALLRSLHVVRAYFSVPGTYMEGAYDG